jgi:hypothetical protein
MQESFSLGNPEEVAPAECRLQAAKHFLFEAEKGRLTKRAAALRIGIQFPLRYFST